MILNGLEKSVRRAMNVNKQTNKPNLRAMRLPWMVFVHSVKMIAFKYIKQRKQKLQEIQKNECVCLWKNHDKTFNSKLDL